MNILYTIPKENALSIPVADELSRFFNAEYAKRFPNM